MKHYLRYPWRVGLISVLSIIVLSGCAPAGSPSPLLPVSDKADGNNLIYWVDFWIATIIFIGVQGALIYAVIRFKEKDATFIPRQIHGNTRLEVIWTVAPALLLIIVFSLAWPVMKERDVPPDTTMTINVRAHQWWWEFEYPDTGVIVGNEVHIPVGEAIRITLNSDNVLHSFWVPRLSGKMDVVPGRTNETWLQADKIGVYRGICAELCGDQHANMNFTVIVESRDHFNSWLNQQQLVPAQPEDEMLARGKEVLEQNACVGCHVIAGTAAQGKIGPDLTHFANRRTIAGLVDFDNNEENLRRWLNDSQGLKPGNKMPNLYLPQEDLDALVAYLGSLK